jgi:hypothetical protein
VLAWGALRRGDWRWLAVVVVVGAPFIGLYAHGQGGSGGAMTMAAVRDPLGALRLALGYLMLPWTRAALSIAWLAGAMVGAVALVLILRRGGRRALPHERVACALMLFTLGTAAMAGLGRTGLQDPANVPLRYGMLVAPLHIGLLMIALPFAHQLWRANRAATQALTAAVLLAVFAQNLVMAAKVIRASDMVRNLIADFHAGRRTPEMLVMVHPDLARAEAISSELRRDGLFQHELHLKARTPAR